MKQDHTKRFTGRVESYVKYRPSYPAAGLVEIMTRDAGLSAGQVVADIGSGTGILSKILLESGCNVIGVEPNQEMRLAAEQLLFNFKQFKSVAACAEYTTLPNSSVDLVTAGQAFHWFDPDLSRIEFTRILKPSGFVVLVWNGDQEGSAFWKDYEAFLLEHGTDYRQLKAQGTEDDQKIHNFFAGKFLFRKLPNHQDFDLEGFKGRFCSVSHAPLPGDHGFDSAIDALTALFYRHERKGRLRMEYDTKVYVGRLAI